MPKNQVTCMLNMRRKESVFPLIPDRNGVDCELLRQTQDHKCFCITGHKDDIAKFIAELIREKYLFDLNVYNL
jgi:hypothetical protein